MQPPYDVLNLYHVIRLNWSSFLNRPRALASFASYYCLFPRSHLRAADAFRVKGINREGLERHREGKSEAPGYATTQAVISSTPQASPTSPWVPEVFFLSRAPTCAERCAQSVPRPRNFSRPHFEDGVNTKTYCKTANRACSAFSVGISITWVGISVSRARSGFCVKRRKTTEDFAQCEPWHM